MNSMTGFGRGQTCPDGLDISVEISTVNRKNLDISVSLPKDWQELERPLAARARELLYRGKVAIAVRINAFNQEHELNWDDDAVEHSLKKLGDLSYRHSGGFKIHPLLLWNVAHYHRKIPELPAAEQIQPIVATAFEAAMAEVRAMREEEGRALAEDLAARVATLRDLVGKIEEHARDSVPRYRELLLQRLKQAGLEIDLEDDRVLKEIALFADRCDISEELTRLASHLGQFSQTMESTEPLIGRKLEFILQEIHRECNTIGSKANNIEVSRNVIDCKAEIERIREQVQNVE